MYLAFGKERIVCLEDETGTVNGLSLSTCWDTFLYASNKSVLVSDVHFDLC